MHYWQIHPPLALKLCFSDYTRRLGIIEQALFYSWLGVEKLWLYMVKTIK